MDIKEILEIAPFSLDKGYKHQLLNERLHELTHKHYAQCEAYRRMMNACGLDINNLPDYEQLPFCRYVYLKNLNFVHAKKMI